MRLKTMHKDSHSLDDCVGHPADWRPHAPMVAPVPAEPTGVPLAATPESAPVAASREEKAPEMELPRESAIENPLGRAPAMSGSAFGGYGELTLNAPSNAPSVVDMRRLVYSSATISPIASVSTRNSR